MKFLVLYLSILLLSSCAPAAKDGTKGQDGLAGLDGAEGTAGAQGATGAGGAKGADGASCSVAQYPQGALITCPDGSSALVLHGQPGPTGPTGHGGKKK